MNENSQGTDWSAPDPEREEWIASLRPIDDPMMQGIFIKDQSHDGECAEHMLRILLDNDSIKVTKVMTQYEIKNLHGHSVTFDLYVETADGGHYDVEFQRDPRGAGVRRMRFHGSMLDTTLLKEGEDFELLRRGTVIFVNEKDVLGYGLPIHHIRNTIEENGKHCQDGRREICINCEISGEDSALGMLVHDLFCADPEDMYHDFMKTVVRRVKTTDEGKQMLSGYVEKMRAQGIAIGEAMGEARGELRGSDNRAKSIALEMLKEGFPTDRILKLTGLAPQTLSELKLSL